MLSVLDVGVWSKQRKIAYNLVRRNVMLEAVYTVLQSTHLTRGSADQVSTATSFASNPDSIQKIPQAPYISPYIHVDIDKGAVLQIRDSDTGDVVRQIPSETTLEARQRFQQQIDLLAKQVEGSKNDSPLDRDLSQSTATSQGMAAVAAYSAMAMQQARVTAPTETQKFTAPQQSAQRSNVVERGSYNGGVTLFV
jgi:hypothetical protein